MTIRNGLAALLFFVIPNTLFPANDVLVLDEVVVEQNVTYGTGGDENLQLDLARPKDGDGPFAAIVFIHGGGWAGGNRQAFRSKIEQAARKGYVAASISYRLTEPDAETKLGQVPFPAQIHDCKCAIRWLRSVAEDYHVDPDRIGVAGASAGGHLSLLVGLCDESAKLEGQGGHSEHSSGVRAVVNIFGPTDLAKAYQDAAAARVFYKGLCRGTPETAAEMYHAASPVTYVTKDDPSVMTLHGDKDTLVPVSQAKLLDETMKLAGASHELIILEGQGHGFAGEAAQRADEALWRFFAEHLKSN
jgi:acetyl esterase/lipase